MARPAPIATNLDFAAFLEQEIHARERHEFVDGNLFVMPGGTDRHNLIAGLLFAQMLPSGMQLGCQVYFSDVLIKTPDNTGYYPDIFVVCDPSADQARVKYRPCLIVEVLSKSTEAIDRGEKLRRYCSIPSLETYIMLEQREARAEIYSRQSDGSWRYSTLEGDAMLILPPLQLEVSLAALYTNLPAESDGSIIEPNLE
jgi:Uma2 family endonuclease